MESMKRCPQCGKNMPADRTYCMNCGVTVGIKCPDCRTVLTVGAGICTACGHSFIQKKKLSTRPFREGLKKLALPLTLGLPSLLLILSSVAAGNPAVYVSRASDGANEFMHRITGYELIGHFFSREPDSITTLLGLPALSDTRAGVLALLFAAGAGWLLLLAGVVLTLLLVACNLKRLGRTTGRRLFVPLSVTAFGSVLLFVTGRILTSCIVDARPTDPTSHAVIEWNTRAGFPWVVLILSLLLLLSHTLLYAVKFRHTEAAGERSLSHILLLPLTAVGRGARRLLRRIGRRRKQPSIRTEDDEPGFVVTPRFSAYLILFGAALIFTQALLSKVSHIFFWFIFILPPVMLVYVLLAARSLSANMRSETVTTEKNSPYTYEFCIENRSIMAIPFLEAKINIPQSNSVRCTERLVWLSMAPLTGYTMKNTVTFRLRGTYDIGVKCFYVYDFFRLFRAKVEMGAMATVYVMPRRLSSDDALAQAISDSTVRTVQAPLVVDKLEISDIRDYRNGDPLKSIHWKLSSKSDTLVVKDYNTGTANQTVIYFDLAPHFPDEPPFVPEADDSPRKTEKKRTASRTPRHAREKKPSRERLAADRALKESDTVRENGDTHALSDDELNARLQNRASVARALDAKAAADRIRTAPTEKSDDGMSATLCREPVDVHEPATPSYYEDMNEYLADGVVELTIAMVLSELRQGHEVLLLWFDRRSDSGICAYSLHGADEFESIYHLFATAPLCDPSRQEIAGDVTALTAMAGHLQNAKQLFVLPGLDIAMLERLTALSGTADAGQTGFTEVVLYSPEERFKYPIERLSYLESCREQLAAHGISLTVNAFGTPSTDASAPSTTEGGVAYEA